MYHSVPKSVMLNPQYMGALAGYGPDVKHILDCPEYNIPSLARSQANLFTDRIKQICPLMFPGVPVMEPGEAPEPIEGISQSYLNFSEVLYPIDSVKGS